MCLPSQPWAVETGFLRFIDRLVRDPFSLKKKKKKTDVLALSEK